MNKELTQKLLERFPEMYKEYYLPMTKTCMCWGFDHGDGWFDIIWQLSLVIEEELKTNPIDDFSVQQVKEKFGTLRFYCSCSNELIDKYIGYAEKLSEIICEKCGLPGKLGSNGGWVSTVCKKCAPSNHSAFTEVK